MPEGVGIRESVARVALTSSTTTAGGLGLLGARTKDDKLRKRFELPENDIIQDEFMCAYYERVLRQGHMYITSHHVCFQCNAPGLATRLKIAVSDITDVRCRNVVLVFPTAIEIQARTGQGDEREYLFTSFFVHTRQQCFDLVNRVWQVERARLRELGEPVPAPTGDLSDGDAVGADVGGDERNDGLQNGGQGGTSPGAAVPTWPTSDDPVPQPETSKAASAAHWTLILDHNAAGWHTGECLQIFSESDPFFSEWHDAMGDTNVVIGPWTAADGKMPHRVVTFTAKIHDPPALAPSKADCESRQVGRLHKDGTFVLDVKQTMPSVKVASFTVEFLWILTPAASPASGIHFRAYIRVNFHKPSFIAHTIRSQTISQALSCYAQLRSRLKARFPPRGAPLESAARAASDVHFAMAMARQAALRMPARWKDHLLCSLNGKPCVSLGPCTQLHINFASAMGVIILALLAVNACLPLLAGGTAVLLRPVSSLWLPRLSFHQGYELTSQAVQRFLPPSSPTNDSNPSPAGLEGGQRSCNDSLYCPGPPYRSAEVSARPKSMGMDANVPAFHLGEQSSAGGEELAALQRLIAASEQRLKQLLERQQGQQPDLVEEA